MDKNERMTIFRLLGNRKRGFIIYIFAAFLPILQQLTQEVLFSFAFTVIEAETVTEILIRIAILVAGMLLLPGLFWISRRLRVGFMRDILLDIRQLGFSHIMSLPVRVFSRKSRDDYLSRLVNDINIIENDFFLSFLNVIFNGGLMIVSIIILLVIDPWYGLVSAVATVLVGILGRFFRARVVRLKEAESEANKDFSSQMSNVYSGLEIVKLNRLEDAFEKKAMGHVTVLENIKMRFNVFDQFQGSTMQTLGLIFTVLSFAYVAVNITRGHMTLAFGIFITQITQRALWGMVQLFPHQNKLRASESIFDRIANGDEDEAPTAYTTGGAPFHFSKELNVDNLRFSYDDKAVLRKASFSIRPGDKVLLKGASGSGKTTLLNLLAGVYVDYEGSISYDGTELRDIDPVPFNRAIAEIYQDVFLFEDTLLNNITLYGDYSEQEVTRAVEQAGLAQLVNRLPEGLMTFIEENGKNLSGGERQRVSIARAVIKGASILFADEATSNLDESLGRHVEETLLSLDATVIAISHRYYEGVSCGYSKVLEIERGTVSEWQIDDYFKEVV
ncbi:MAG: ABC transporter ATP-binding protein/permease [Clostridiales bacterium]|jgi:ATP-binding cassette subfamily C protein|nr:ABC transporter ATP-binding protein/permease [Clostridiales bacterium]MCK9350095.1 ABC transporter ATP-binding protein/permease [Clostridiales bacterium]